MKGLFNWNQLLIDHMANVELMSDKRFLFQENLEVWQGFRDY
jgi:hypothetical protein